MADVGMPVRCALGLAASFLAASCGQVANTGADADLDWDARPGDADAGSRDGGGEPARTFVYVANSGSDSLSVYEVQPDDGSLAAGPVIATGAGPGSLTVHPSGRFLYVLSRTEGSIYQYAIDQETGVPVSLSPPMVATGAGPLWVVSPATSYLYVPNGDDETISGYEIDPDSGLLTELASSPFPLGSGLTQTNTPRYTVASSDDGALVIAVDSEGGVDDELRVFPIDASGNLSDPDAYDLGADRFPILGALDPDEQFFFSVLRDTDQVQSYQIDAARDLTPAGQAQDTGDGPFGIAAHPTQPYLYVSNFFADTVSLYTFNGSGELTFVSSTATGDGPETIAFDPDGLYMYIPNFVDETISQFKLDPATGVPAPIGAEPAATQTQPLWIATSTIGGP